MNLPTKIVQHVIERLGGMEMAYEFFKLHPEVESMLVHNAEQAASHPYVQNVPVESMSVDNYVNHFFEEVCHPCIEEDREHAKAELDQQPGN